MTKATPRTQHLRRAALLVGVAVVATMIVPLVVGGGEALARAVEFPLRGHLALFGIVAANWIARTLKLQLLLERLDLRIRFVRVFAMSLGIDFAFITTPAGLGGYAAGIYYLRRAGASSSAAASAIAVDQLLDLAFFALALPVAGISLLWSDLSPALSLLAFTTGAGMLGGGAVAFLARRRLGQWALGDNALVRRWPALRRRQHLLHGFLAGMHANLRLLRSGGAAATLAIAGFTALQWLTRYGVLWFALELLGQHVPFALTLLLQALILHAALWTGVPSGGGSAELGLTAALTAWVPATAMASALLLWRLATFDLCLLAGLAAVVILAHWRHAAPHPAGADAAASNEAAHGPVSRQT